MPYTVIWTPSAIDKLANVWVHAPDRQAVTAASHQIDRRLRTDPENEGEEFYGDRLLVEAPLAVIFTVHPDDRRADVIDVQHI
jgi:plasmid stabilization system protein ParE